MESVEEEVTVTKDTDPMSYNIVKGKRPPKATSESAKKSYQTRLKNGTGNDGKRNGMFGKSSWNNGLKLGPNLEHSKRMKGRISPKKGKKYGHISVPCPLKGKTWKIFDGKRVWI